MIHLLFNDGTTKSTNDATIITVLSQKGLFKYIALYKGKAFERFQHIYRQTPLKDLRGLLIIEE